MDYHGNEYEVVFIDEDGVSAIGADGEEVWIDSDEIREQDKCFYLIHFE